MKQKDLFQSIKLKKEIQELFKKGKSFNTKSFYIKYTISNNIFLESQKTTSDLPIMILWAISKKTGNAVVRNKIKRRSKAALFQVMKSLEFTENQVTYRIAFMPKLDVQSIAFEKLKIEMNSIISRVLK